VAVLHALAILLALIALAILPCLVIFVVFADAVLAALSRQARRLPHARRRLGDPDTELIESTGLPIEPASLQMPIEPLGLQVPVEPAGLQVPVEPAGPQMPVEPAGLQTAGLPMLVEPIGPPVEQIAADLRRLGLARRTSAAGSVRHVAATRGYDQRLVHACRALELDEHLSALVGVDLDLERLRVESQLVASGFVLDSGASRTA
jgi:hypothetical protein